MSKDLGYYLNKYYRVEIKEIPEEDGGGFVASLPQFGRSGIIADGDTPEEALHELDTIKELRFNKYLEEGLGIPEPEEEPSDTDYSGRFLTRIPSFLHKELADEAKRSGVSLNMLVTTLLSSGLERKRTYSYVNELKQVMKSLNENICDLKYDIESKLQLKFNSASTFVADEYDSYKAA